MESEECERWDDINKNYLIKKTIWREEFGEDSERLRHTALFVQIHYFKWKCGADVHRTKIMLLQLTSSVASAWIFFFCVFVFLIKNEDTGLCL